ncbi:MAG: DUF6502 family protein [Gammaproteobacteria bacterium]
MSGELNKALSAAILRLLRPLIRILLRNGIAYGSFAELAKKVFVDVAFEEFGISGKKQTVSRVSVLTGLTRKETKRLHELENPDDQGADAKYNRGVRVVSGWVNDPLFLDESGRPLALDIDGSASSFAELVKKYSGDMPTKAMLAALVEAGSVEQVDGKINLITHAYIPGKDPVEKINILGSDSAELISTIDHNLTAAPSMLRYQRKVSNQHVKAEVVGEFQKISSAKAQALLEELDHWLSQNEVDEKEASQEKYVSMGIYFYERDVKEEDES